MDDRTGPLLALVLAVLAIVLLRQFALREVRPWFYVWVVLLLVIGFAGPGPRDQDAGGLAWFALTLTVSAGFGVLRGRRMPLWREPDGRLMRKGDGVMAGLWLATIATRLLLDVVGVGVLGLPFLVGDLYVAVAMTLAVQQYVLQQRGRSLPRRPG